MGPGTATGTPTLAVTPGSKPLNSSPTAMVVNNAGICVRLLAVTKPRPDTLLDISAATAPAAAAFAILSAKLHVPRVMSAIEPAENPVKSVASQPEVKPWSGMATTVAVTSPGALKSITVKSFTGPKL